MLKAKRDQDAPDVPVKLDGLTDEPPRRSLARLMTWAGVALLAVSAALLAARSEAGGQRFARLWTPAPPAPQQVRAESPRPPVSDPLLVYETRRLADQIRVLAADREALMERLATVERSVGDVTASIPRQETTGAARPPVRVIASAPPVAAVSPPPAAASPPVAAPVPVPSPAPAVTATPEAADSTAIRTEFGVDLAGDPSIDGLRSRWQQLRAQHGPVLEGLRPVVAIQEGGGSGLELRLVAGPLSNANAAARLCATLTLAGVNCKPTVFDGQRLALR
jgi:hypothetical protein